MGKMDLLVNPPSPTHPFDLLCNLPGNCQKIEQGYYRQIPSSCPRIHHLLQLILLITGIRLFAIKYKNKTFFITILV